MGKVFFAFCISLLYIDTLLSMQLYDTNNQHITLSRLDELNFQVPNSTKPTPAQVKATKLLYTTLKKVQADVLQECELLVQSSLQPHDLLKQEIQKDIQKVLQEEKESPRAQKIITWCTIIALIQSLKKDISPFVNVDKLNQILVNKDNLDITELISLCTDAFISKEEAESLLHKKNLFKHFCDYLEQKRKKLHDVQALLVHLAQRYEQYVMSLQKAQITAPDQTLCALRQAFYFLSVKRLTGQQIETCISALGKLKDMKPSSVKARTIMAQEKDKQNAKLICDAFPFLPLDGSRTLAVTLEIELNNALSIIKEARDSEMDLRRKNALGRIYEIGQRIFEETFKKPSEYIVISALHRAFVKYVLHTTNPYTILLALDEHYSLKFCHYCMIQASPNVSIKRCGGCNKTYYCSLEHQKADWQEDHKEWCKLINLKTTLFDTLAGTSLGPLAIESSEDLYFEIFASTLTASTSPFIQLLTNESLHKEDSPSA